jgi:hypothetical protein
MVALDNGGSAMNIRYRGELSEAERAQLVTLLSGGKHAARKILFVFLDAHRSWRHVKVTEHRTARDFAVCMRDLADIHYPNAELIRVVMDNLSTHNPGALYEAFPAPKAHRILQRLEFHYTPKHASWLNMVEIEIGVLRGQCLDRRIGERETLIAEIEAWQRQRNTSGDRIKWKFTTQKARDKLARAYPDTTKESKSM